MQKGHLFLFCIISLLTSCINNQSQTNSTALQTKTSDVSNKKNANLKRNAFVDEPLAEDVVYKQSSSEEKPAAVNKTAAKAPSQISLKDAYKNYFPIGAATYVDILRDPVQKNFILTEFSSITPRGCLQPAVLNPKPNVYKWDKADSLVNFAVENNLKIRGHCLVYYLSGHMPRWMYKQGAAQVSKDTLLERIHHHINTVVSRYKGKIYCWDVVNEALSRKPGELFRSEGDTLHDIAGDEYVEKAFRWAHEADPNAKLFYNEDYFQDDDFFNKTFQFLKKLKEKGVPIDGVGIQCHLGIDGIGADKLQKFIDAFSSIGLSVQITELDVSIYKKPFRLKQFVTDQYTSDIEAKQREDYKTVFEVCRKNKGKVTGITFWGFADDDGLNSLTQKLGKKDYPLLFDRQFKPKKAFFDVVNF